MHISALFFVFAPLVLDLGGGTGKTPRCFLMWLPMTSWLSSLLWSQLLFLYISRNTVGSRKSGSFFFVSPQYTYLICRLGMNWWCPSQACWRGAQSQEPLLDFGGPLGIFWLATSPSFLKSSSLTHVALAQRKQIYPISPLMIRILNSGDTDMFRFLFIFWNLGTSKEQFLPTFYLVIPWHHLSMLQIPLLSEPANLTNNDFVSPSPL